VLGSIRDALFAHIVRLVDDRDIAEDVLQETLYTIARRLPTLRDPQWFRAWVYRIATRHAVRRSRREKFWIAAEREETLATVEATELTALYEAELHQLLRNSISELPPASQLIVRMHYLDELSYAEIAEALEIPLGTVKSRVAYGITSLRSKLAGVSD
jgi:RNA polymerase sigma-70 factor (ECF subfamily)